MTETVYDSLVLAEELSGRWTTQNPLKLRESVTAVLAADTGLTRSVHDTLILAEALSGQWVTQNPLKLREYVDAVLESSTGIDKAVNDPLVLREYLKLVLTPLVAHVADGLSVNEPALTGETVNDLVRTVYDGLHLGDVLSAALSGGAAVDRSVYEGLTLSDTSTATLHAAVNELRSVFDGLALAESVKAVVNRLAPHASESLQFSEYAKAVLSPLTAHVTEDLALSTDVDADVAAMAGGHFKAFWTRRRGAGLITPGVN